MTKSKFSVSFYTNQKKDVILENVSLEDVYDLAVKPYRVISSPNWHVRSRRYTESKMCEMELGELFIVCFQEASLNPEDDLVEVTVTRNR